MTEKCSFPLNPHDRLFVCWSVGLNQCKLDDNALIHTHTHNQQTHKQTPSWIPNYKNMSHSFLIILEHSFKHTHKKTFKQTTTFWIKLVQVWKTWPCPSLRRTSWRPPSCSTASAASGRLRPSSRTSSQIHRWRNWKAKEGFQRTTKNAKKTFLY